MKYIKKFNESFFTSDDTSRHANIGDSAVEIVDINTVLKLQSDEIYYVAINDSTDPDDIMEIAEFVEPIPCTVFAIRIPEALDITDALDIFASRTADDIIIFKSNTHLGLQTIATEITDYDFELITEDDLDIKPFIGEF